MLAVGLENRVYLWSETKGVTHIGASRGEAGVYVSSVSFSSAKGGNCILAIGRSSGKTILWGLFDDGIRFDCQQSSAVSCVSFKPLPSRRPSQRFGYMVDVEELIVGDENGNLWYYFVEWTNYQQMDSHGWGGTMTLVAKINAHSQGICGIAWSFDGYHFATGSNDNACCLFNVQTVLAPPLKPLYTRPPQRPTFEPSLSRTIPPLLMPRLFPSGINNEFPRRRVNSYRFQTSYDPTFARDLYMVAGQNGSLLVPAGREKHKWIHSAAIKAIAFCPWQSGLIAVGGGSNDRAIHFYHTSSGACLATINVQSQVTSLIWSTTKREIAATLGYTQPEHPYRVVVFSWPECRQVVAIPWNGTYEMRAIYAIPYPGGPNEASQPGRYRGPCNGEGGRWWSRTAEEGSIVVACSDENVKFFEVWSGGKRSVGGMGGMLGGSDILEGLEGVEKEGKEVIR